MNAVFENSRSAAQALDQQDPLRQYRERFHFPDLGTTDLAYFSGHSLGLQPDGVAQSIQNELESWSRYGVEGHFKSDDPWLDYHELLTQPMADIVGALPSEIVCMNALTVNLHLLFVSFYRPTPKRFKIISEARMFPSDRYLLETQAKFHGFDPDDVIVEVAPRDGEWVIREDDILATIEAHGESVALVFFGGVNYVTGQWFDIPTLTRAAHRVGALAGFDLAHAAGNVPLALHEWGPDFAAWCSYKYLNCGPGNAGAIFVHQRHEQADDLPRFGGWWGHDKESRFQMAPGFTPIPGAEGWQLSNAPIFGMAAMRASLGVFSEIGMAALREKSVQLTAYLEYVIDDLALHYPDAQIRIISPQNPDQRGSQLSVHIAGHDRSLFDRLIAAGGIADFREPCIIRIAPAPMYNSFEDVYVFGQLLARVLDESADA
ncbi:MAG: kynureninase [Pseudomonadota bacterium]